MCLKEICGVSYDKTTLIVFSVKTLKHIHIEMEQHFVIIYHDPKSSVIYKHLLLIHLRKYPAVNHSNLLELLNLQRFKKNMKQAV